ncbi:hypothetical protein N2603_36735 [Bradyrhizobium huanghuaihaiense]|uniref:hypothetical protein n=1 Tax=Bradyrhizobium huanghuaihaiense TaxID=990078 RepID=UPI0021AADE8E|nr:hypothetical protein [Bradyrhizobium sp. CB3035]UWU75513.1 hypothetical protein N2603_36735 [Bradyrhizobium sp. CB3035]
MLKQFKPFVYRASYDLQLSLERERDRRSLALRSDGTAAPKSILLDVEVLDATFE